VVIACFSASRQVEVSVEEITDATTFEPSHAAGEADAFAPLADLLDHRVVRLYGDTSAVLSYVPAPWATGQEDHADLWWWRAQSIRYCEEREEEEEEEKRIGKNT
jgi:hypothetical protein